VCDTLCVRTSTGMVFAKNSDRPPGESQVLLAHLARSPGSALDTQYLRLPDPGAYAFVGSHPSWLWGAEHGVNEHGVAIGNEKVWTIDDPHILPPALLGMDLVRLGLERGRTADDARDVITSVLGEHGQGGNGELGRDAPYFSSFLVVDARTGWVIETSARTWAARPVADGSSISNRISLSTDWTVASADVAPGADFDRWRSPTIPTALADHRLAATRACVAKRLLGSDHNVIVDVVAALRDHGDGPWGAPGSPAGEPISPVPDARANDFRGITVCMHVPEHQATTASMVVDLRTDAPPRAWACLGNPCAGVYVPFFPPAVPTALADPAQWQRFAQLRARVEADPDALANVRGVLAPVENDLWADADERFATAERAPLERFAGEASARVEAALAMLGV
jgi:secernin